MEAIEKYDSESIIIHLSELIRELKIKNNTLKITTIIMDSSKNSIDQISTDINSSIALMAEGIIDMLENEELNSMSVYALAIVILHVRKNISDERIEKAYKLHHN
jgi:hypothetical protein